MGIAERRRLGGRNVGAGSIARGAGRDRTRCRDHRTPRYDRVLLPRRRHADQEERRLLPDELRRRNADAAAQRGRRRGVGAAARGDPARELRLREEAAFFGARADRVGGEEAARFFVAFRFAAFFSASSLLASVGAFFPDCEAPRLLSQIRFDVPISSTLLFETTDRGASAVTSTSAFANSSRCLRSSHSLPLLPGRP